MLYVLIKYKYPISGNYLANYQKFYYYSNFEGLVMSWGGDLLRGFVGTYISLLNVIKIY